MLSDLLNLWRHMAQMLNAEDPDPSHYMVFKSLLNDWSLRSNSIRLERVTERVRLELESLSEAVALSTGMSMSLIWEAARPTLPSTAEHWTAYDQLLGIAKLLDNNLTVSYGNFSFKHTDC